jgi:hypothetical protein
MPPLRLCAWDIVQQREIRFYPGYAVKLATNPADWPAGRVHCG